MTSERMSSGLPQTRFRVSSISTQTPSRVSSISTQDTLSGVVHYAGHPFGCRPIGKDGEGAAPSPEEDTGYSTQYKKMFNIFIDESGTLPDPKDKFIVIAGVGIKKIKEAQNVVSRVLTSLRQSKTKKDKGSRDKILLCWSTD